MHISSIIVIMRIMSVIITDPPGHSIVVDSGPEVEMVDCQVEMCAGDVDLKVTGLGTVHSRRHSQLGCRSTAPESKQMA